jgi:hypothetical protein
LVSGRGLDEIATAIVVSASVVSSAPSADGVTQSLRLLDVVELSVEVR